LVFELMDTDLHIVNRLKILTKKQKLYLPPLA